MSRQRNKSRQQIRIAFFTHDTFGLGHVTRVVRIMREISRQRPDASLLLISGCPALNILRDLPANADYVKIPTVVKTGSSGSQPPHLPLPVMETTLLRSRITREAVLAFAPDVFVVDNFPLGSQGELLPVLQAVRQLPVRTVLGLRDILDEPHTVQADWRRQGIYDVLDRYYDTILVYGSKKIFDVAQAYTLPTETARKVSYCGYITDTRAVRVKREAVERELGMDGSFILATGGGGGDALPLLKTFIKATPDLPSVTSLVVTGPLMGASDRDELYKEAKGSKTVVIRDYVPDLRPYLKTAAVVVSMCGYNTVGEILAAKPRAVVVPRTWRYGQHKKRTKTKEEGEQIMRARAVTRLGYARLLEPRDLNPRTLSQLIKKQLTSPKPNRKNGVDIRGIERAVKKLLQ